MSSAHAEHGGHHPSLIGKAGMLSLIAIESSFLLSFAVVYLFYIGKSTQGPYPHEVLTVPWLASVILLSSSVTVHLAVMALRNKNYGAFNTMWLVTIACGAAFIGYTLQEWGELIHHHSLTMHTNVFGSTFYSLIGAHAFHVVVGLLLLIIVLVLSLTGRVKHHHAGRVDLVSWYWHFVDVVWIVVFAIVYMVGR